MLEVDFGAALVVAELAAIEPAESGCFVFDLAAASLAANERPAAYFVAVEAVVLALGLPESAAELVVIQAAVLGSDETVSVAEGVAEFQDVAPSWDSAEQDVGAQQCSSSEASL